MKLKRMNREPRGTFYTRQNGQLTATVWKDSRVMMLLSTGHQGWRDPTNLTLKRKCPDEATGRLKPRTVPAPSQAVDYTKSMGGVDRGDQLRSYHTCARKSQLWWRSILYILIDITRVNAWLSYKHHHPAIDSETDSDSSEPEPENTPKMTSKFVEEVATSLIEGYSKGTTPRQFSGSKPVPAHNSGGH
ncbi:piggyBac transposable element-derived protein 4-like [Asterias amurensis]|uniref:piggyBac transposable element-derived protein 4-like n=1 Tax=Asterias amurensis TaxID=7602 RepID=UPI003AB306F2